LAGISLLEYYLLLLSRLGIDDVTVVIGYLSDKIVQHLKSNEKLALKTNFMKQEEQLGTGHAVSLLKECIGEESFLLLYSDIFVKADDLRGLLQEGLSSEFDHIIAVAEVKEPWRFGVVLEESGMLKRIIEKPPKGAEPSNKVIAGVFYFKSSIFTHIEKLSKSPRGEYELTDAIQEAAECGENVRIFDLRGGWTDAGTFPNLLEASRLLFEEVISERLYLDLEWPYSNGILGPGATNLGSEIDVQGPVFIGNNVKVGRRAKLGPYTVLYKDVVIGEGAQISNSILLQGVSIGKGAIIERSIIGDGSSVGRWVRPRRKPERGEFGMILGKTVHINDLTEIDPGTILA